MKIEEGVSEAHVGTSGREADVSAAHQLSVNCSVIDISTGNVLSGCLY